MLIVHNAEPRLHTIPGPAVSGPDGGLTPKYHLTLKPGANSVDPEKWKEIAEYGTVKVLIKAKVLRAEVKQGDFEKLVQDEAIELVDACLDREQLRTWEAGETRPKVKLALAAQIKKITVPREKKE